MEKKVRSKKKLLLLGFWMTFSLVLVASYQCNLRAYLMSENFEKVADTEADILDQNRGLYLPKDSALMMYFANSPNVDQRKIYEVCVKSLICKINK